MRPVTQGLGWFSAQKGRVDTSHQDHAEEREEE